MCIRIENQEITKQSLLNDTFRRLLNRLHIRKRSPPKDIHSKIIKQKSQEHEKCKRYSAGFKYKHKNSPSPELNNHQIPSLSFVNSPTHSNDTFISNGWLKKQAKSDRCKTQITVKTLHSKNQKVGQFNSILIAKSFILQEFQPRKTQFNSFMKRLSAQEQDNVQANSQCCLDNIVAEKKSRQYQRRVYNLRKNMKKTQNKQFQAAFKNKVQLYEPWQTEQNHDYF